MAAMQDLADKRSSSYASNLDAFVVLPGLNARDLSTPDNVEHVETIAALMIRNGYDQSKPLQVFLQNEHLCLADGHVRYAAAIICRERGVDLGPIPWVMEPRGTNEVDRILGQSAHNSGKRLTMLEEGYNFRRALAAGRTITQIAEAVGKSSTYVSQAVDFQAAPDEVHAAVKAGAISPTLAAQTMRREGDAGAETIRRAVEGAKAKGKSKATQKDVEASGQTPIKCIPIKVKKDRLVVRFGSFSADLTKGEWMALCGRIKEAIFPLLSEAHTDISREEAARRLETADAP